MEKITSQTMKLNKFLFPILFLYFFYLTSVFAVEVKKSDIKIIGNKSISKETVLNYANSKKEILNTDDLSILQKKLFETNFFSKVDVKISGNEVIVHLSENPIVEYLVITGLEKNQDLIKRVEKVITLKENNIFSEFLLNNDIKSIYELLSAVGYFKSTVEYKVNQIKNNKVNIFLDIKLNQKFFVKNIFFIGDKKISTSDLKSIISTTEKSWLDLFGNSSVPSVDRINFDISSLKNFYLSKGYYDVQISNGSIDIVEKNMANITFVIDNSTVVDIPLTLVDNSSSNRFWISNLSQLPLLQVNNVLLVLQDLTGKLSLYDSEKNLIAEVEVGKEFVLNGHNLRLTSIIPSTGLQVKSDPGTLFVYIGFLMLMFSTLLSYVSYSQIWAFKDTNNLYVAGQTNRAIYYFEKHFTEILGAVKKV